MNAETRKLNELIFEYLRWNGYQYTAEMLLTGIENLITEFIFSKIRFFCFKFQKLAILFITTSCWDL